ncbi:hypothetical protein HanRHA438_Chr10g0444301 [Helianthus annuus]|nr:hypothetical protein HanIR_Chr10g0465791 [Helianthus annuus]KAJ0878828.1 hypothetical protein HanRHA438_Chr10g0444301 [Helianthus annuus]
MNRDQIISDCSVSFLSSTHFLSPNRSSRDQNSVKLAGSWNHKWYQSYGCSACNRCLNWTSFDPSELIFGKLQTVSVMFRSLSDQVSRFPLILNQFQFNQIEFRLIFGLI